MKLFSSKAFLLFLLLFFLMFSVVIGDNVSEALLLSFYSADKLSLMFMVNAVGLFTISLLVMGAIDKVPRYRLYLSLVLVECLILGALWLGIHFQIKVSYLILFSFAYVGKILLFLVFWTAANDLSNSREAKSLFPLVGSGGVLGGTLACFSTAYLVSRVGPANLMFMWIALLLLSTGIMSRLNRCFHQELNSVCKIPMKRPRFLPQLRQDVALVTREPLLGAMSILYFFIFFLLISLDFHFFMSLKAGLSELLFAKSAESGIPLLSNSVEFRADLSRELSKFLGIFRGLANSLTFGIQICLAGFILKKLGTARSMFILPVIFTGLFFLCFLQARFSILPETLTGLSIPFSNSLFLIILIGMTARIAIFDSMFSPNFQIFFSSLPLNIRGRGKMFIEGLAKPLAILLAGGSVMLASRYLLKTHPQLIWTHFLFLFLVGLALCAIVFRLQRSYTDSISRTLGRGKAEQIARVLKIDKWKNQENFIRLLVVQLFDLDEDIRTISIEILCQLDHEKAELALNKILKMTAYRYRPFIIHLLGKNGKLNGRTAELEAWLWDSNRQVVTAAVDASRFLPHHKTEHLITPYIQHEYPPIAAGAIRITWPMAGDPQKMEMRAKLERLLKSEKRDYIELVMALIAELADVSLLPLLKKARKILAAKTNRQTALKAYVKSLACFPDKQSVTTIFGALSGQPNVFRKSVFSRLSRHLCVIQASLPDYLASFNPQQRHYLFELLFQSHLEASRPLKKAFLKELRKDLQTAFRLCIHIHELEKEKSLEARLLMFALIEEPLLQVRLNIMYLLALAEPTNRLFYIVPRLLSKDKFYRTTAVEALETTFPRELWETVSPLFLEEKYDKLSKLARENWNIESPGVSGIVEHWMDNSSYPWSRTCAYYFLISDTQTVATISQKSKFIELMQT